MTLSLFIIVILPVDVIFVSILKNHTKTKKKKLHECYELNSAQLKKAATASLNASQDDKFSQVSSSSYEFRTSVLNCCRSELVWSTVKSIFFVALDFFSFPSFT